MQEQTTRRFAMMMPIEMIERIDRWRGGLGGIPNRSEAIRRLVASGLKAETQEKETGHGN